MTVRAREVSQPGGSWLVLVAFIAGCLAAGIVGTLLSGATQSAWYSELRRPGWAPPSQVFGPVWTTLYVMMGTAAWLIWRGYRWSGAPGAWTAFGVQLVLNAVWSGIFFGLREPGWAFAELVALWLAILATMSLFWRLKRAAGLLLVPYLAWVTFAGALNYAIWRLNA